MTRIKWLSVFAVLVMWQGAEAVTLDTQGGLYTPFQCHVTAPIQASGDALNGKYKMEGMCFHEPTFKVYFWKAAARFDYNAPYEKGEALEDVKVYQDAARTQQLGGGIGTVADCTKNPFVDAGASCTTTAYNNTTGMPIYNYAIPLTRGLAVGAHGQTGTAQQGLQQGQGQEDLSDWNPYAGTPEAKAIEIVNPGDNVQIMAAEPPGFNAALVMKPKGQVPSHLLGEFQRAELATQVGDINTGKPYPKSWATVPGPLSPSGGGVAWNGLDSSSYGASAREVKLLTGASNAPLTPGYYRVRIRGKFGNSWSEWEPWRYFWVAAGASLTPAIAKAGGFPGQEVGEQLDRIGERLTALERQGGQACADCPRLRRDLDALRLHLQSPRPGGQEPQALLRDADRLGRDLDRVEARLPGERLAPTTPGALPLPTPAPRALPLPTPAPAAPAPGPAPGGGPQLGARTPALEPRAAARPDPAVEQLGRDLDRLAAKLAALDAREAQVLLREVQALRRQLAGDVTADQLAPLLRRHTQLEQQTDGLETRLRQVQPQGRTLRVLPGTAPAPTMVPRAP